jgi:WD40 repeat protein
MYGLWITTPTLTQKEQSALPITAPGETSEPLHVYKGHTEIVISIAINGDHLYTSGYDKTIKVWNRTQHKLTKVMYLNKRGGLWDIRVDAASNTCYSCSHDKSLQVWDMTMDPWECVGTMRGHWGVINAIELHEGILYSAADDMTVRSWNLEVWDYFFARNSMNQDRT